MIGVAGVLLTGLLAVVLLSAWSVAKSLTAAEELAGLDDLRAGLSDVVMATESYRVTVDEAYLTVYAAATRQVRRATDDIGGAAQGPRAEALHAQLVYLLEPRLDIEVVREAAGDGRAAAFAREETRQWHAHVQALADQLKVDAADTLNRDRRTLIFGIFMAATISLAMAALVWAAVLLRRRSLKLAAQAGALSARVNERYRLMVEGSPDVILLVRQGRIEFVNGAGAALLKGSSADIVGRPIETFFAKDSAFLLQELPLLGRTATVGAVLSDRVFALDGSSFPAGVRGYSHEEENGLVITVKCRDVSEYAKLQEQLLQSQRLESVGKLTGGVAHDFNNLLTVILGCAEELRDQLAGRDGDLALKEAAGAILQATEQGADLTAHLLAFARRQPLSPRIVDVDALIEAMEPLLRRTLGEDVILATVHDDTPHSAIIDPGQLENAILNLCLNARHAMPEGGRLTIEVASVDLDQSYVNWNTEVEPGRYVQLAISDNGVGMAPDVVERIFDPFFTTRPPGEGSGLGLSMVYGFLKQSRGHVKAYSELGEGTTINLYLPAAGAGAVASPALPTPVAVGGSERVLVVEDDDLVRNHVVKQLRALGYDVAEARNGDAALLLLAETRFALLFTDVVMPGELNGRRLADAARRTDPAMRVLFTSGYTENAIVHHGRLDEGVRLLQKPYRRADLARAVREAIDLPVDA